MTGEPILTVSEANGYIKALIERDAVLSSVAVRGEISNFKAHYASGHLYFSLKDEGGQIRAVMFARSAATLDFTPADGIAVKAFGRISVYPRDGQYQLYCERLLRDGAGTLWEQFEKLKKKLAAEGLFDEARKKKLPVMPRRIGVITSATGAAVRDIFSVLGRRQPSAQIVFCRASVQGAEAPGELRAALRTLIAKGGCDVIIIGRGGGSAEDLWAFNDEWLVRDIAACPVPVISAVGHETDFTLSDFAADMRAPTPSAAAELAVPDAAEQKKHLESLFRRLVFLAGGRIADARQYIDRMAERPVLKSPKGALERRALDLSGDYTRLCAAMKRTAESLRSRVNVLSASLQAMDPMGVLTRGYSYTTDRDGKAVSARSVTGGERITVRFSDGSVDADVAEIMLKENV